MKVYMDSDEWYPVYSVRDDYRYPWVEVEVDEATFERWKRVHAEFEAVQVEMEATAERRPAL